MKKDTWLVVSNSCSAKIYKVGHKQTLIEVEVLEHPESRLHNRDLVSDKPGRDFESVGHTRHAIEPRTWPQQQEVINFAKEVANHLEQAFNKGDFDKLYIAANPNMLGVLRNAFHPNTAKHISGEVDKDMTHLKPDEIIKQVPFMFYS
jgi:protein required for attachment to host cells